MRKILTVDDVISRLGGDQRVAALLALKTTETLRHWRKKGKVPSKHWPAIHTASRKKITYEMLARANGGRS